MRVVLLGVRGSTPAPGEPFVRYGGHTSSVAVLNDSRDAPQLVLDAGTGIRDLPGLMDGQPFRGAVVLTHLHWDHVHGLPFCPALDRPDSQVELWVPGTSGGDSGARELMPEKLMPEELLARVMSPPHFPIDPGGLLGAWRFRSATAGRLPIEPSSVGGARVELAPVRHKGGTTFAVRVDLDGASIGYVPDHTLSAPGDPVGGLAQHDDTEHDDTEHDDTEHDDTEHDAAAVELLHGVDVLLHDGQFEGTGEARLAAAYGHSTIEDAVRWADRCKVGALVLTHHGPARTDDQLDALAERWVKTPDGREVSFARQASTLEI